MEEQKKPTVIVIHATKPGYTPIELPKTDLKWDELNYDNMLDLYLQGCYSDAMMAAVFGVTKEDVKQKRNALGLTTTDIKEARRTGVVSDFFANRNKN